MTLKNYFFTSIVLFSFSCNNQQQKIGETEIATWQNDKTAAVSLTFDDGSKNQFIVALPILNTLHIPATFFIITGDVAGSQYHGKFIGRPLNDIIRGTADTLTNKENFFERASAIGFSGYKKTLAFHTDAGTLYEEGEVEKAYRLIDSAYKLIRNNKIEKSGPIEEGGEFLTWPAIKEYAAQGHEFASHTVTHPRLAVLTEPNINYELEKSREEILNQLGERYIFSAECPYGTEDERVMSYAHKVYPALRNRMPESFLGEINRASNVQPGSLDKEYVQFQRGATTKTPLPMMKAWVDTVSAHNNEWLVLTFHGVDGIGYEALSHEVLGEYFEYIRKKDDKLWIATFGDATKYMRERMHAKVESEKADDKISVDLTHSLDKSIYDIPLTLRTYVPDSWKQAQVNQRGHSNKVVTAKNDKGNYILYQLVPNKGTAEITSIQ